MKIKYNGYEELRQNWLFHFYILWHSKWWVRTSFNGDTKFPAKMKYPPQIQNPLKNLLKMVLEKQQFSYTHFIMHIRCETVGDHVVRKQKAQTCISIWYSSFLILEHWQNYWIYLFSLTSSSVQNTASNSKTMSRCILFFF